MLATMPDGFADCIVTSPPYWAKRDYGIAGQYGHEPDPGGYIATLVAVFREARRVLAPDGTCWLNLGDSYSFGSGSPTGLHAYVGAGQVGRRTPGLGAKNLLGLPWLAALTLQTDGWIIRNAVVWHKPNAMPESVRDRLNCRYELIFLLVKSRRYWFDLDPIRVPHATARPRCRAGGGNDDVGGGVGGDAGEDVGVGADVAVRSYRTGLARHARQHGGRHPGDGKRSGSRPAKYGPHTREVIAARRYGDSRCGRAHPNGRNPGDVWSVPTRPYRGPHFAAFPIEIPARCIKAGCKPGGMVLDPFCGTGTTGLAALALGRRFTGIDLNPAFAALAAERLRQATPGNGNGEGSR